MVYRTAIVIALSSPAIYLTMMNQGISAQGIKRGTAVAAPAASATFVPAQVVRGDFATAIQLDRNDPRFPAIQELNQLRSKLEAAKTDEEREELQTKLREATEEYFDRDMNHRRAELNRLQKRAGETESLLSKRTSMKEELVDLQLQVMINNAEGLGLVADESGTPGGRVHSQTAIEYRVEVRDGKTMQVAVPVTRVVEAARAGAARGMMPGMAGVVSGPTGTNIDEAYQALREAESEDEKTAAREQLQQALSEYFDADMERRRQELDEVKEGLAELASHLEERAEAKEEIIDLHVKLYVNEAEGLGFFPAPAAATTSYPATRRPPVGVAPRAR